MDIQDCYLFIGNRKFRTLLRQVNFTRSKLNETHGINLHIILYNVSFPFVATPYSPLQSMSILKQILPICYLPVTGLCLWIR